MSMTSMSSLLIAWVAGGLLLLAIVAFGLARWGDRRFFLATQVLTRRLEASRAAVPVARYHVSELRGLPAPVQRYFQRALKPGQRIVASVEVSNVGTFNMSRSGQRWRPFNSHQSVVTRRPGFVWSARISLFSGVTAFVHDAYVAGQGILRPTLMGLFALGRQEGGDALDKAELIRYLAEAAWYPTALLPSQGVSWSAVDERSAHATLRDGRSAVTLLFRFNDHGMIESACADARGAVERGILTLREWEGRWSNYRRRDGMRIPTSGEASWVVHGNRMPYWRGAVTSLTYGFVETGTAPGARMASAAPSRTAIAVSARWRTDRKSCAHQAGHMDCEVSDETHP